MPESNSVKGIVNEEGIADELSNKVAVPSAESVSALAKTCTVCSKFQFEESKIKDMGLPTNKSGSPDLEILTVIEEFGLAAKRTPKLV